MGLYKKKNIALGAFGRLIFPENLWTREFLLAWAGCFLTVIVFDLLWCAQTTFRAFSFAGTYINAFTLSIALSLPTVLSRRIWPQITAMAIVDLLMIANLMYCRTYFNSIPPASYMFIRQVFDFHTSIADSWSWRYLALPAVTLLTLMLMHTDKEKRRPSLILYLAAAGAALFLSAMSALFAGGLT